MSTIEHGHGIAKGFANVFGLTGSNLTILVGTGTATAIGASTAGTAAGQSASSAYAKAAAINAAGVAGCTFVYVAHSQVAYAWGIEEGLIDKLLENIDTAPVEARLKPLLAFVRKLSLTPGEMTQNDADATERYGLPSGV